MKSIKNLILNVYFYFFQLLGNIHENFYEASQCDISNGNGLGNI